MSTNNDKDTAEVILFLVSILLALASMYFGWIEKYDKAILYLLWATIFYPSKGISSK